MFCSFLFYFLVLTVAWILLIDKKTLTYQLLFKLLQSSAQERKLIFSPKRLMTDFETAVKSTFTTLVRIFSPFAKEYGFCNGCLLQL
jgi:hypothetical protein